MRSESLDTALRYLGKSFQFIRGMSSKKRKLAAPRAVLKNHTAWLFSRYRRGPASGTGRWRLSRISAGACHNRSGVGRQRIAQRGSKEVISRACQLSATNCPAYRSPLPVATAGLAWFRCESIPGVELSQLTSAWTKEKPTPVDDVGFLSCLRYQRKRTACPGRLRRGVLYVFWKI
jgi:hypothetical protein